MLIVSDGVVLAFASALVYLTTFVYEYAYCSYFRIATTLINPSLATVLAGAAAILYRLSLLVEVHRSSRLTSTCCTQLEE